MDNLKQIISKIEAKEDGIRTHLEENGLMEENESNAIDHLGESPQHLNLNFLALKAHNGSNPIYSHSLV